MAMAISSSSLSLYHYDRRRRYCYYYGGACISLVFLSVWFWQTASLHASLDRHRHQQEQEQPQEERQQQSYLEGRRVPPAININAINNHAVPLSPLLWNTPAQTNGDGDGDGAPKQVVKRDKDGKVVHRSITKLTAADLEGLKSNSSNNKNNNNTDTAIDFSQAAQGREPLVELLRDAGVTDLEAAALAQLPTWAEIASLYYTSADGRDVSDAGPVVVGLETCETFRRTIPLDDASIGVAGLFNTGTNPLAMYLAANCRMPHNARDRNRGVRWQVPWGKHMVASRKWNNTAGHDHSVNKTNVLPVVLVRDPYTWARSMCHHPYAAKWEHSATHCPNLVDTRTQKSVPVTIGYPQQKASWDSLVDLWRDWYQQYLFADYPRLIVRFEDLIFRPQQVINEVCTCAGAVPAADDRSGFRYVVDAGKWGGAHHSSNLLTAMHKYGSAQHRFDGWADADREFARGNHRGLDHRLLTLFQYAPDTG